MQVSTVVVDDVSKTQDWKAFVTASVTQFEDPTWVSAHTREAMPQLGPRNMLDDETKKRFGVRSLPETAEDAQQRIALMDGDIEGLQEWMNKLPADNAEARATTQQVIRTKRRC